MGDKKEIIIFQIYTATEMEEEAEENVATDDGEGEEKEESE